MVVQEVHPQSSEGGVVVDRVHSLPNIGNCEAASTSGSEDDKEPSMSERENGQPFSTSGTEDDRIPLSISEQKNGQTVSTTGTEDHKRLLTSEFETDRAISTSHESVESNRQSEICRVCQCDEPDRRGDAALVFLGICPPVDFDLVATRANSLCCEDTMITTTDTINRSMLHEKGHAFIKFVSPDGEVFTCNEDLEAGTCHYQDALITLGCSCKNDLSLAHYACALRWFITHGSLVCEICGSVATNIREVDVQKVMASLKDCDSLRERTAAGELAPAEVQNNADIDPDAVAAIRRQRLTEISMWFNPQNHFASMSQRATDQVSTAPPEEVAPSENRTTKWAIEGTGILIATGLLTVTLEWLIAPRVGKRTAKGGLHFLLGGLCALTVVVVLRFIVLPRIKYGPARYWAILFVFWFLVFGVWASRARNLHNT